MDELINPFEAPPTPTEKALWDKFVAEYVKDYDAFKACLRLGFLESFAQEYARIFMSKGYIQRAITAHKNNPVPIPDQLEADRALMLATLREACHHGPYQSRVLAVDRLGAMHGINKSPDRSGEQLEKLVDAFATMAKVLPD